MFAGLLFLFLFYFFLFMAFSTTIRILYRKYKSKKYLKKLKNSFLNLDSIQKNIIIDMLCSENKSLLLEYNSGVAQFLVSQKFIYLPSQNLDIDIYSRRLLAYYIPNPWVINAFNEDPDFFLSHRLPRQKKKR